MTVAVCIAINPQFVISVYATYACRGFNLAYS